MMATTPGEGPDHSAGRRSAGTSEGGPAGGVSPAGAWHPGVEDISEYTEGLLRPGHTHRVRRHLTECVQCSDTRRALDEIRDLLGRPENPRIPSDVAGRIDAALAAEALLASAPHSAPAAGDPSRSAHPGTPTAGTTAPEGADPSRREHSPRPAHRGGAGGTTPGPRTSDPDRADPGRSSLGTGDDLAGLDLAGLDLAGLDLTELDLTGLDLTELDLTELGIAGMDLTGLDTAALEAAGVEPDDLARILAAAGETPAVDADDRSDGSAGRDTSAAAGAAGTSAPAPAGRASSGGPTRGVGSRNPAGGSGPGAGPAGGGPGRRRHRRRLRTTLLAAAAVAAVGVGTTVVTGVGGRGADRPPTSGPAARAGTHRPSDGLMAPDARHAAGASPTGTVFTDGRLTEQIHALVARSSEVTTLSTGTGPQRHVSGSAGSPSGSSGASGSSAATPRAGGTATALPSCVVSGTGRPHDAPLATAVGRYHGIPVGVVVYPASGNRLDVYIVDRACGTSPSSTPGHVELHRSVPRG